MPANLGTLSTYVRTVNNIAALSSIPDGQFTDGSMVFVASQVAGQSGTSWKLDKQSSLNPDGATVSATHTGVGRWILITSATLPYQAPTISVISRTALSAYLDAALLDGAQAFNQEAGYQADWELRKTSTLATDGLTCVATASGNGRWILKSRIAGRVPVTECGAKGDGSTDDSGAFQALATALGSTGVALFIPGHTYVIGNPITLPNHTKVQGAPGAVLQANLSTSPFVFANSTFVALNPNPVLTTTVAANVTLGRFTVQLASVAGLTVGGFLGLQNQNATNRELCYLIRAINGNVVTVERPIKLPFVVGDNASGFATVPQNIHIEGNGLTMTGNCNRYIEFSFARDCTVSDIIMRGDMGVGSATTACMSFDIACYHCEGKRIRCDGTGLNTANGTACLLLESNEGSGYDHCEVVGIGSGGSIVLDGIFLQDCNDCFVRDCRASNCLVGLVFGADGNSIGSLRCRAEGGNYDYNTSDGIQIDAGSSDCDLIGVTANGSGGNGIFLTGSGSMQSNRLTNVEAKNAALHGIVVAAGANGTVITSADVSGSGQAATTYALDLLAPDTIVRGLVCVDSSVQQHRVNVALPAGGIATMRDVVMNFNPGVGSLFGFNVTAGTLDLSGAKIQIGHSDIGVFVNGGVAKVASTVISPSVSSLGENGINVNAGTCRIGFGVDATACAAQVFNGGGTVTQTQGEGLYTDATTTGTVSLTHVQAKASGMKFSQSLTGSITYNVPAGIPGLWNVDASGVTLNGHTLSVGVAGGSAVSLTAAQHIVYSDGTNMKLVV